MSFTQGLTIINSLHLDWKQEFLYFTPIAKVSSGSIQQVIAIECLFLSSIYFLIFNFITFLDHEEIFYYKSLMSISTPIFFGVFLIIFWIAYAFKHKMKFSKMVSNFLTTFSILILFFLPSILNTITDFINCTNLNGEEYVSNFPMVKCSNNPEYLKWRNYLILPSFLFFCVFLPFLAFVYAYKNKESLHEERVMQNIGFLFKGYEDKYYYWYILLNILNFLKIK